MHIAPAHRKLIASLAALVALSLGFEAAQAQFTAPTCTPPNCSPAVIQNIDISGTAQSASINITGDAKLGASFQAGANAPVLSAATSNLYYGNVSSSSTAGALMLLQNGAVDRLRVTLTGQLEVPLGTAAAPSYTFIGDTNNGFYSSVADSMTFVTNGVARETINNSGVTLNSGVLSLPAGTAAAPSLTFTGDTNTGIYHVAADSISLVTNGTAAETISSTGAVTFPGNVTVNGTFTASGGYTGDGSQLTNINASNITSGTLSDARLSSNVALYNANGTFTGANTFSNASNSFTGSGAGLTSLNGSNITSGTISSAVLPATVAYTNATQTFTGANTFSNASNSFTGSGAGLTALNATQLTSGTLPSARLSGTYSGVLTFSGNDTLSGNDILSGMTTFGGGSRVLAAGQNLLYGLISSSSTGGDFLLMQKGAGVNEFYVDYNGNVWAAGTYTGNGSGLTNLNAANLTGSVPPSSLPATTAYTDASQTFTGANTFSNAANSFTGASGAFTTTLTVAGQNVCQQNGVNCPATLGGSGTANYVTKFTGTGNTVGNSMIQDNGTSVGVGTSPAANTLLVAGPTSLPIAFTATTNASNGVGIYGFGIGSSSTGLYGQGTGAGVFGLGSAAGGVGLQGTGQYAGVTGTTSNVWGYGVLGTVPSNSYVYGVYGTTPSSQYNSAGVAGLNTGNGMGGYFQSNNATTYALLAYNGGNPSTGYAFQAQGASNFTGGVSMNSTLGVTGATTLSNSLQIGSLAAAPGGANGKMYYDTASNKFKCYENGAWANCVGIGGSGTANYVPKFTAASTLGNSVIYDDGSNVGIGNAVPSYKLDVNGQAFFNGEIAVGGDISSVWTGYGVASSGNTAGGHFYNTLHPSVYGALGYTSSGNRYGLYGSAYDGTGTNNYAVYAAAGSGTNNYGIYSAAGNNYFAGSVGIGTLPNASYPLDFGSGLSHNKVVLYDGGGGYTYGMGVVSGQFSFHLGGSGAQFIFYNDYTESTPVFQITGGGDVIAPYNTNGTGDGWHYCYTGQGYWSYCTCASGKFVGNLAFYSNQAATYCYGL